MRIGEALIKNRLIAPLDLEKALKEQEKTREKLGEVVTRLGFVNPDELLSFLASFFDVPFINLKDTYKDIKPEVVKLISEELAYRFMLMPVNIEDGHLLLAMADPLDVLAVDAIKIKTGLRIKRAFASRKDISQAIEYCYHQFQRLKEHVNDFIELETDRSYKDEDSEKLRVEASDPPVVQYVNSLIIQALHGYASDIHIKPKQDSVELNFRIDGVLYNIDPPPKEMFAAINTRIKILANLDITEHRLPQDGRFKVKFGINEVDIRTSCFPTIYGESIVMRLLDVSKPLLGLEDLGFSRFDLIRFRKITRYSYGLILVTGPTGSGKTTTLYSVMNEIQSKEKNMITLEDPVEYRLPFLQQSQINAGIGFDFARGLRSILRQDPDIIMVGEIRDKDTAEIAIHAALTGHLVFSTLHTNDASSAAVRLMNMGVEPFLITSSLLGVLAQRLIRCICPHCREEYTASEEVMNKIYAGNKNKSSSYFRGKGCPKCFNSGFKGRTGIFELLMPDDEIRNLMLSKASSEEVRHKAQQNGMKTLRDDGLKKLKDGITTPEEVLRVTQETQE
jgi:type IV pilus assembly protein PilB